MRLLIAGASGMVGSEIVRLALQDEAFTAVTAIVRKRVDFDPRVSQVIHQDFLNYDALRDQFVNHDVFIWALGISQSRVTAEEYFTITHDYAAAAAKSMLAANPACAFIFLSAMGADSAEKTKIRFGRIKGQTENTLKALGINQLYIFRPGAIISNPEFGQAGIHKKIERLMMRSFSVILPKLSISVTKLARLIILIAKTRGEKMTYSQRDIYQLTSDSST